MPVTRTPFTPPPPPHNSTHAFRAVAARFCARTRACCLRRGCASRRLRCGTATTTSLWNLSSSASHCRTSCFRTRRLTFARHSRRGCDLISGRSITRCSYSKRACFRCFARWLPARWSPPPRHRGTTRTMPLETPPRTRDVTPRPNALPRIAVLRSLRTIARAASTHSTLARTLACRNCAHARLSRALHTSRATARSQP